MDRGRPDEQHAGLADLRRGSYEISLSVMRRGRAMANAMTSAMSCAVAYPLGHALRS